MLQIDGATHDFIIVGGGTAGSLIAGQLAKMSNVSILLIEAGGLPPLETEVRIRETLRKLKVVLT